MSLFASAFLALYLSTPANSESLVGLAVPSAVQTSFASIDRNVNFAGECIDHRTESVLNAEYEKLYKRHIDAIVEARGVWPAAGDTAELVLAQINSDPPWPSCRSSYVQTALKQARNHLDDYDRLFRQHTARMALRGAWVGPIQLCRGNVVNTEITTDPSTTEPVIFVTLTAPLRATLFEFTRQSVGRQLPIRLDGEVIVRPNVNEPIEKGEFQVSGSEPKVMARLAERAAAPC